MDHRVSPVVTRWEFLGVYSALNIESPHHFNVGTFLKMRAKYMALQVAEFQFWYKNRFDPDMFGTDIGGC